MATVSMHWRSPRAGGEAFAQLATELGVQAAPAAGNGRLWALGDFAANLSDAAERTAVIEAASDEAPMAACLERCGR